MYPTGLSVGDDKLKVYTVHAVFTIDENSTKGIVKINDTISTRSP